MSNSKPSPSFGSKKRTLYSAETLLALVAALALLILSNYLGARHYTRFDLSGVGAFTLSPKTLNVLEELDVDIDVVFLFDPAAAELPFDRDLVESAAGMTRDLLDEYMAVSSRIHKTTLEIHRDLDRVKQLVERYSIRRRNVVLLVSGSRHRIIPIEELARPTAFGFGPQDRRIESFTGEEAMTSGILRLTRESSFRLYWTQGHGEKDPENENKRLAKQLQLDGYELESLDLQAVKQIPEDARIVIINGPRRTFLPQEIELLKSYLLEGGRLFLALEPTVTTGLEAISQWFQVEPRDDLVVHRARQARQGGEGKILLELAADTRVLTNDLAKEHPVTAFLHRRNIGVFLPEARSLTSTTDPLEGDVRVWPLIRSSEESWSESSYREEEVRPDETDPKGPLTLAFAARRYLGPADESGQRPHAQAILIGDSDFTDDRAIEYHGNLDLAQAMISWLAGRERLIEINPRATDQRRIELDEDQRAQMGRLVLVILPLLAFTGGVGVWLIRRR
ncbi:MAG: Gldg family protein [Planctomycetota bacterium]|nr:Gldg family protein [Planctomycetota bacterium]